MRKSSNIIRYVHTLRYLKPVQIYARLWFQFYRPRANLEPSPAPRRVVEEPVAWCLGRPCMTGPDSFRFLNEDGDLSKGWDPPNKSRLWRYNLHYFDDLNSKYADDRHSWHQSLISRWIAENRPGTGSGWEPYPLSLRIVNWIKWSLFKNVLNNAWFHSLAVQVRYLDARLEHHLLGNHLFANAKALIFAGLFFDGREADRWLTRGLRLLNREITEQILSDGGHFERSPMYHGIILEDLLDLLNLLRAFGRAVPKDWTIAVARMRTWLWALTHPDGEIALLNDAAFKIAADYEMLEDYAGRLGMDHRMTSQKPVAFLAATGYIRCEVGAAVLLIDVAPVGPDYIPAHAHADTLSFEFSLYGRRIAVDSGISTYEKNSERQRQRGTAAHNTVIINGQNSSDVWGGFRVARRARPINPKIIEKDGEIRVNGAHDGYRFLPGKPIHHRQWGLSRQGLRVRDRIDGRCHSASARYHFHPEMGVELSSGRKGKIKLPCGRQILFQIVHGVGRLETSTYHPEFNVSMTNECLAVFFTGSQAEVFFKF